MLKFVMTASSTGTSKPETNEFKKLAPLIALKILLRYCPIMSPSNFKT